MKNKRKEWKKITILFFIIYLFLLFLILVFKFPTGMTVETLKNLIHGEAVTRLAPQWVPFWTIADYVKKAHAVNDWFVKNLVGNVALFIPYGILIPCFSKWNGWKVVLSGCFLSVFIEILQYATALGQLDIDDVILNTFGVMVGYVSYVGFRKIPSPL